MWSCLFLEVLGVEPRALFVLNMHPTPELYPKSSCLKRKMVYPSADESDCLSVLTHVLQGSAVWTCGQRFGSLGNNWFSLSWKSFLSPKFTSLPSLLDFVFSNPNVLMVRNEFILNVKLSDNICEMPVFIEVLLSETHFRGVVLPQIHFFS
jgi:hypothetical protein